MIAIRQYENYTQKFGQSLGNKLQYCIKHGKTYNWISYWYHLGNINSWNNWQNLMSVHHYKPRVCIHTHRYYSQEFCASHYELCIPSDNLQFYKLQNRDIIIIGKGQVHTNPLDYILYGIWLHKLFTHSN